jgi:phospholipase C
MHHRLTKAMAAVTAAAISLMPVTPAFAKKQVGETATPIKHIVVIFQENVSFDHYFGTYPVATNPFGEPQFKAKKDTPTVNGYSPALAYLNPNALNSTNGTGATNPFRLDRSQALTADQNHAYGPEQTAAHMGLMDLFPSAVGTAGAPPNAPPLVVTTKGLNLGYYDGNTVTAYWNYAQNYAMSDNSFGSTYGPSTPGLINLLSGQTNGVVNTINGLGDESDGGDGTVTMTGDADPLNDVCSNPTRPQGQMSSKNIGDLLSAAGVSWGAFMGGFDLTVTNANGTTKCNRSTGSVIGPVTADYVPHHAFFQYWATTANPAHTRPASANEIGHDGPANHNYDTNDFFKAAKNGNLPAVSFLKAQAYQDGHAGYSSPLDEQNFVVSVVNAVMKSADWESTAIVIAYDDSDGWYDHVLAPVVNQSTSSVDALTGPGTCGNGTTSLPGPAVAHAQGRCGYGPRLPLIVISPYAKKNFVDHSITDQSSIITFIEDNWLESERIGDGSFDSIANSIVQMFDFKNPPSCTLLLDPNTGLVTNHDSDCNK